MKQEPSPAELGIKALVSGTVEFQYYRDGNLWYSTSVGSFLFPVPIADIGNATFLKADKAMLFMRYIRKHLDLATQAKQAV
jgi:hypothetical protein